MILWFKDFYGCAHRWRTVWIVHSSSTVLVLPLQTYICHLRAKCISRLFFLITHQGQRTWKEYAEDHRTFGSSLSDDYLPQFCSIFSLGCSKQKLANRTRKLVFRVPTENLTDLPMTRRRNLWARTILYLPDSELDGRVQLLINCRCIFMCPNVLIPSAWLLATFKTAHSLEGK